MGNKMTATTKEGQAEVVLVGCGVPLRGMGWYHAVQMLGNECPSAKLCYIVEPWFLSAGKLRALGSDYVYRYMCRYRVSMIRLLFETESISCYSHVSRSFYVLSTSESQHLKSRYDRTQSNMLCTIT